MNSVILIGRLTRDPEIRYTQSQMAVATFTVAIDRPQRRDDSGDKAEKKTDFPRVTVFGRQAENCERFLAKGRLVGVQGRLQTGSYQNKDGNTVYTTDVVADRVEFLEWGDKPASGAQMGAGNYQAPSQGEPMQGAPSQGTQSQGSSSQGIPPQGGTVPPQESESAPQGFSALDDDDDDIPF